MNVIELPKRRDGVEDIVSTLRRLADRIESGEEGPVSTVVVVLSHETDRTLSNGDILHGLDVSTFSAGPKSGVIETVGALQYGIAYLTRGN